MGSKLGAAAGGGLSLKKEFTSESRGSGLQRFGEVRIGSHLQPKLTEIEEGTQPSSGWSLFPAKAEKIEDDPFGNLVQFSQLEDKAHSYIGASFNSSRISKEVSQRQFLTSMGASSGYSPAEIHLACFRL